MPLTTLNDISFLSTFAGVNTLQALEASWDPAVYPNGVPTALVIEDGWMKATIRQTDPETFGGIRSEVTLPAQALNDEIWFTWEMMIKSADWPDNSGQIILAQMHPKDTILAASSFNLVVVGGVLFLAIPLSDPPTESLNEQRISIGQLRLNHVYKFGVHCKWSTSNTGFLEVYVDGRQIYKNWGRPTAYVGDAPYFKLGIYDGPHNADFGTKSARFRNLKRYSGVGGYAETIGTVPYPRINTVRI